VYTVDAVAEAAILAVVALVFQEYVAAPLAVSVVVMEGHTEEEDAEIATVGCVVTVCVSATVKALGDE